MSRAWRALVVLISLYVMALACYVLVGQVFNVGPLHRQPWLEQIAAFWGLWAGSLGLFNIGTES